MTSKLTTFSCGRVRQGPSPPEAVPGGVHGVSSSTAAVDALKAPFDGRAVVVEVDDAKTATVLMPRRRWLVVSASRR
jgi:hypothetical protein